jgi:putative tricarboxylic transport membrane protein
MKLADSSIAALFFLLGLYALWEAQKLDFAAGYGLGPGFFPFWLGVAIALLGGIVLFQNLKKDKKPKTVSAALGKKRFLVAAALVAFVPAVGLCGFVVAFSLLVAFLLFWAEGETWWQALLISVATGVGFHVFFVRLLEVELPKGPWNF